MCEANSPHEDAEPDGDGLLTAVASYGCIKIEVTGGSKRTINLVGFGRKVIDGMTMASKNVVKVNHVSHTVG